MHLRRFRGCTRCLKLNPGLSKCTGTFLSWKKTVLRNMFWFCFVSIPSNTGRLNCACIFLENYASLCMPSSSHSCVWNSRESLQATVNIISLIHTWYFPHQTFRRTLIIGWSQFISYRYWEVSDRFLLVFNAEICKCANHEMTSGSSKNLSTYSMLIELGKKGTCMNSGTWCMYFTVPLNGTRSLPLQNVDVYDQIQTQDIRRTGIF